MDEACSLSGLAVIVLYYPFCATRFVHSVKWVI